MWYYIRRAGVDDRAAQVGIGRMASFTITHDVVGVEESRRGEGRGGGGISILMERVGW